MSVYMGDYLGFQFGDVHSYELNITRVSTNDRYVEDLNPNFSDKTAVVPGSDGTYYWDSNYTQRVFNIDFAYDNLREEDLQRLRQILGSKEIKPLIFDETPYKKYMVKAQQPPNLRYICFDVGDIKVYKGEGNIRFIAYYPFALSVEDAKITYNSKGSTINNNGDLDSDFKIIYKPGDHLVSVIQISQNQFQAAASASSSDPEESKGGRNNTSITIDNVAQQIQNTFVTQKIFNVHLTTTYKKKPYGALSIENLVLKDDDVYILIDTRTNLIEGLDSSFKKTGNLYNKYITAGDFFKAPPGYSTFCSDVQFYSAKYNSIYF